MSVKENRDVVSKIITSLKETQAYQEEVIRDEVDDWLDEHPEATTTVEDGAISYAKLNSSLKGSVDDISELKTVINTTLVPLEWTATINKGGYWNSSGGVSYNNKYAKTNSKLKGYGYKNAVELTGSTYIFGAVFYDQSEDVVGVVEVGSTNYIPIPRNAVLFGLDFMRADNETIQDSDLEAIVAALISYEQTDKTLTKSNFSADAKIVGDSVSLLDKDFGLVNSLLDIYQNISSATGNGSVNGDVGDTVSYSSSTTWKHGVIAVTPGEQLQVIVRSRGGDTKAYFKYTDSDGVILNIPAFDWINSTDYPQGSSIIINDVVPDINGIAKLYVSSYGALPNFKERLPMSKAVGDVAPALPGYYYTNNYLPNKEAEINELYNITNDPAIGSSPVDSIQFIFFSDYHYDPVSGDGGDNNTRLSPKLMKQIMYSTGVRFILFGGDIANSEQNNNPHSDLMPCFSDFKESFGELINKMFPVFGNHEFNCVSTEKPTYDELYQKLNSQNEWKIGNLDSYGDYTVDIKNNNLRIICVNCPDSISSMQFKVAQKKWFCQQLEEKPANYDVIFLTHRILEWTADTETEQFVWSIYTDATQIAEAIEAFEARTSYTYDNTTYDYTSATGNVICCLVGHSHLDASYILPSGVPIIMITSDSCRKRLISYDWSTEEWTKGGNLVGTVDEQAFDVVTIDKVNKIIYMNRIGWGDNRTFTYGS